MLRRLLSILLVAVVATPLAACGKKNLPEAPEGATWPQGYPEGAAPPADPYGFMNRSSGRRSGDGS